MQDDPIRIVDDTIVHDGYFPLRQVKYALRHADGKVREETREVYANDAGVAALLYDTTRRTVLLTRQFRIGARLAGHHGFVIAAAAGILEGADPAERMRAEIREELGYAIDAVRPVMTLFASPGSLTERVHYFLAEYRPDQRCDEGGGKEEEGEDIEVLELGFDEAFAMVASGAIDDVKTVVLLQHLRLHLLGAA